MAIVFLAASIPGASQPPETVKVETPVYVVDGPVTQPPTRWTYRFSWSRFLSVGEVSVTAGESGDAEDREIDIWVRGKTGRIVDWIWKYRINGQGTVGLDPFRPQRFEVHDTVERRSKITRVEFNGDGEVHAYRNKRGTVRESRFEAPNTYDMGSTIFLVLNQDLTIGEHLKIDLLAGTSRYLIHVRPVAREEVKAAGQRFDAIKLLITSEDLTDPEDTAKHRETELWVSEEKPRMLLRARAKLWVGAVRAELASIDQPPSWPDAPPEIDLDIDRRREEQLERERLEEERSGGARSGGSPMRPR